MLCVMPIFHVYASHVCLQTMVYARGTLVILPRYHPQDVLDTLVEERITIFAGSPTLFTGLMAYDGFAGTDFSTLAFSHSGSSALPAEVLREWEAATGSPIVEGYGQSEAGPVISFNPLHGDRRAGSVGIAVPETEIQIVDLDAGTKVLETGDAGEIRVRGPQIMTGYRNRPEETSQALRDGWLYTGDIGAFDEDGYLYIRDRKKEMVIVSGYNVFPREVEDVLYEQPAVREAAVVGQPDSYRGEILRAVIALAPDADAETETEAILAHCRANLAKYKVPSVIDIVDDIPKTPVGKIDKKALRG
ncbi:MAG: AMP-binding protein [Pseudomonadota bacterium]